MLHLIAHVIRTMLLRCINKNADFSNAPKNARAVSDLAFAENTSECMSQTCEFDILNTNDAKTMKRKKE